MFVLVSGNSHPGAVQGVNHDQIRNPTKHD